MKKSLIIMALGAFITGAMIQEIRIIRRLRKLKKLKKRTKDLKEEAEKLKEMIEMEEIKNQIEKAKMDDPFRKELEGLVNVAQKVTIAKTEEELNEVLEAAVDDGVIKKPYEGDFREFMSNPNNRLDFG